MTLENIDTKSTTGGFAARELLRVAFFIRRPHAKIEAAVADAIALVLQTFPPPALSMIASESGDWIQDDLAGLLRRVRDNLLGQGRAINGNLSLSGDQATLPDYELKYSGKAIDRPALDNMGCVLEISIASSLFPACRDAVLELQGKLVALLDPHFSYVDLAMKGHQPLLQGLSHRYPALDISHLSGVARDMGDKLPGIFWRNYLCSTLLASLGGQEWYEGLSAQARIEAATPGGVWLTLGPHPARGDVDHRESLADREVLARRAHALDLLHVPRKVRYFDAVNGMSDLEAQEAWHLRWLR